ncbi:hypothetical protein H1R20_g6162, partial [Candolleomyces eurysporus]
MGKDHTVKAFVIMSNQGKSNKHGRIDFHAAVRHRFPELCAIGAVAMQLFSHFHIANGKRPDFSPDFESPQASDIGFRSWYQWLLFPGSKSHTEEMSPQAHRARVNGFKLRYDIFCQKVTHTGRVRGAEDGIEFGATVEGVKALGLWSQGGSFRNAYNRTLPIDAMLALAYFNGERKDNYFIPRDFLEPPAALLSKIFPFIEEEDTEYKSRLKRYGSIAKDESLVYFLDVLRLFRRILLQDVAAIAQKQPDLSLLRYSPFNTPAFHAYASTTNSIIEKAEAQARENRQNLPEQLTQTFAAHLSAVHLQQQLQQNQLEELRDAILGIATPGAFSAKKRKALSEFEDGKSPPHLSTRRSI